MAAPRPAASAAPAAAGGPGHLLRLFRRFNSPGNSRANSGARNRSAAQAATAISLYFLTPPTGTYCTLIIAIEAVRLSGWHQLFDPLSQLYSDAAAVSSRVEQQQRDSSQRVDAAAAMGIFFREVDPVRFSSSLAALKSCALAVAASLRVHFARAITLGASLADAAMPIIQRQLLPSVQQALPEEYARWAQPLISWVTRAVAMWCAWLLQRAVSSVHSAVAGGLLAARCIIRYINAKQFVFNGAIVAIDTDRSYVDECLACVIGAAGLYFQFSMGFSPPFPLNVLLLPLTVTETCLVWLAGDV